MDNLKNNIGCGYKTSEDVENIQVSVNIGNQLFQFVSVMMAATFNFKQFLQYIRYTTPNNRRTCLVGRRRYTFMWLRPEKRKQKANDFRQARNFLRSRIETNIKIIEDPHDFHPGPKFSIYGPSYLRLSYFCHSSRQADNHSFHISISLQFAPQTL